MWLQATKKTSGKWNFQLVFKTAYFPGGVDVL